VTPDPEIEIVPFPDTDAPDPTYAALVDGPVVPEPDPDPDTAPESDSVSDAVPDRPEVVAEVPEVVVEPEPDPEPEPEVAPEAEVGRGPVTDVEGIEPEPSVAPDDGPAAPVATPSGEAVDDDDAGRGDGPTARPELPAAPAVAIGRQLALPDGPTPVRRPVADETEPGSRLRRWAVTTRLQLLAMVAVVAAGVVALTAVWGVSQIASSAADLGASERTAAATGELSALLTAVRADADEALPARLTRVEALVEEVGREAPEGLDAAAIERLRDQVGGLAQNLGDPPGAVADTAAFDRQAIEATSLAVELADSVERLHVVLGDEVESARRTAIVAVLVAMLVATLALVGLTRSVSVSIVRPLRFLGRAVRRFADGDTSARGTEHTDEVGLLARSFNYAADAVGARIDRLSADAARGTQLRLVSDALDLADDEADVHRIVSRAFGILAPGHPAELLVHDSTSTRLHQVAVHPSAGAPGCPVETTAGCVAMRRAQAVTFDGPGAINACPHLRNRDTACAAACVPVSVNGHLLGVVHATGPEGEPPAREMVEQLVTLASQVGTRIGAMRTLEVTRMQASTDGLTGLANRRMLEARVGDLVRNGTPFVLAVADLDHFTQINNNYGHEAGDRALQLFASVLEENVRGHDIVARFGGEEFVLVYPEMSVKPSMEAIERIRVALGRAIERAGLPPFTCSFGVTHSSVGDSVESIIRIADAGLLTAKDLGRNRVVYADEELAAEIFGPSGDEVAPRRSPSRPAEPSADDGGPDDGPVD